MIVITSKAGRLANRLFLFAHFIAFGIEHAVAVLNPSFEEYAKYFEFTRDNIFCIFPKQVACARAIKCNRAVRLLVYIFTRIFTKFFIKLQVKNRFFSLLLIEPDETLVLSDERFLNLVKNHRFLLIRGWRFRDPVNLRRHASEIREYFKPIKKIRNNVSELTEGIREKCDVLVGVHIRQGDYRNWRGGRYFYDVKKYVEIMKEIEKILPDNKVGYLICSDEEQDEEVFKETNFFFGSKHFVEELFSLAKCDYLVGSFSTFNQWASFYGSVPLYTIHDPNEKIKLENFRIHGS